MKKRITQHIAVETLLSWFHIAMLFIMALLLGLLSYRIQHLEKYVRDFSDHLDKHSTNPNTSVQRYKPQYEKFVGELKFERTQVKGNLDQANVAIIEFSDFECPYCLEAKNQIEDVITKSEDCVFIHKDYPLPYHENAFSAAIAASCASNQNVYWEMYDLLYQNQMNLAKENLIEQAKLLNLDEEVFRNCLVDPEVIKKVEMDIEEGLAIKIAGTPAFIIGKYEQKDNVLSLDGYLVTMSDLVDAIELVKQK